MKVLKNPDDLILAMHRKRLEYERDIGDADDVTRAKAAGCVIAVVHILTLVSAITFSRDFTEADTVRRCRKPACRSSHWKSSSEATTARSRRHSNGACGTPISAWTPRIPRSGIFCGRSRSSGGRKEEATCG